MGAYYNGTCAGAQAEAKRIVDEFWKECREAGLSGIAIVQILHEAADELSVRELGRPYAAEVAARWPRIAVPRSVHDPDGVPF